MLFAALRESSHTTSMRPLGATESVPKLCHLFWLTGSSLIRMRRAKGLPAVGAAREHHVGAVAGAERYHTCQHVNVVVSRTAGTVHRHERLSTKSYSIYSALNEVATQVDRSNLVKSRCLAPDSVHCSSERSKTGSRPPARKRLPLVSTSSAPVSGEFGILIGRLPGHPAVGGTIEFPDVASEEAGPKLVLRIHDPCPLVLSMVNHSLSPPCPRFVGRLLHEGLAAVC